MVCIKVTVLNETRSIQERQQDGIKAAEEKSEATDGKEQEVQHQLCKIMGCTIDRQLNV